ncbi:MAG: DUF359 domain-containing protein [Natronomonas sp.]
MGDVVVELPESLRGELKKPFGRIYTDTEGLLADAGEPIIAVGDVVTGHLIEANRRPAVALVDGRTKRSAVDEELLSIADSFERQIEVSNPPATLTAELLEALCEAVSAPVSTVIVVDGEEDLAAVPAVVLAPDASAVVYGQPGVGMVLTTVDAETRDRCRSLLDRMDGDVARLWTILDQ